MNQKQTIFIVLAAIILIGGALWYAKTQKDVVKPVATQAKPADNQDMTPISPDASGWKTYRNEVYGFEVKYPGRWSVKPYRTAGIGLPIDCEQTPEECENFGVSFSPPNGADSNEHAVVFETSPWKTGEDSSRKEEDKSIEKKTKEGKIYRKNSVYIPIYGACYATAFFPDVKLEGETGFHLASFYPFPENMSYEDATTFCAEEYNDSTFIEIVESFHRI